MERKTTEKRRDWRGERSRSGLYRIEYDTPMTVLEILEFGPSSPVARVCLFAIVFGLLSVLFSFYAQAVLDFIRGLDILFLVLGLVVLAVSFVLGKKVGRPFAIMLKWVGMPLLFLGVFGIAFARFGLGAFWVGPVDLYLGGTSQRLIADGVGNGAFRSILEMLVNLKVAVIKEAADGSVLTLLVRLYRDLGATMNYYVVIPLLVLISLGIILGTVLHIGICGWITLLLPVAASFGMTRLLILLDGRF